MIVRQDILNKLKDFGLNSYETKLWTSLLSRGISSAGELSDIANVPRSRTYDVLESLEKKGFILMKIGKPIKYIAVAPEEVIERVKKKIQEEADVHTQILDNFRQSDLIAELNLLHSQGIELVEPTDLSGALKGRKNLYNHLELMINQATHSVVLMTTEQGLIRKMQALGPSIKKAVARGVNVRIASNISKPTLKKMGDITSQVNFRHTADVDGRFVVADKKNVLFTFADGEQTHPSYDSGIWVNAPYFGQTLVSMFDKSWEKMTPVEKIHN